MTTRLKQLSKQSVLYILGDALAKGLPFFLTPLYAHFLAPSDYGILAVTQVIYSVGIILFSWSLDGAVVRFYFDQQDEEERRNYLGSIWIFLLASTLGFSVLMSVGGDPVFRIVFRRIPFVPYIRLAIWTVALTSLSLIPLSLFRCRGQAGSYLILTACSAVLETLFTIYFVVILRRGVLGSLQGTLFRSLLLAAVSAFIMAKNIHWRFSWPKLKASLSYSLPLVPHMLSQWALNMSDRLILEKYVNLSEIGIYSLGYQFGLGLSIVTAGINAAWTPFLFKEMANSDEKTMAMLSRFTTYIILVFCLLWVSLTLFSNEIITLIAPPAYYGASRIVPWVTTGFFVRSLYFFPVNILFLAKKTALIPVVTGISAALNIGLNLLLIPHWGIMVAAINTLVGYSCLLLLTLVVSIRMYPFRFEYKKIITMLLCSFLLLAASIAGGRIANEMQPVLLAGAKLTLVALEALVLMRVCGFIPEVAIGRFG